MRIAVDARFANTKTGIGRLTYSLISEILKLDRENFYVVLTDDVDPFPDIKYQNIKKITFKNATKRKILWQIIYLPYILNKEKIEIFFSPNNFIIVPFFYRGKTIMTIQDLIPMVFSEYLKSKKSNIKYKFRVLLAKINEPERIMTISEFSLLEIERILKISRDKIFIIKEGVDNRISDIKFTKETLHALGVEKPYILGIGGMEVRKNNKVLVEAFISLMQKNTDLKHSLIIVGNKESNIIPASIVTIPESLKDRINFIGEVKDHELAALYSNATIFVYPSLYEGFGLPPIESFKHKTPVITSNISSIPEVTGDAAILINPYKKEELENAMFMLLRDEEKQKELVKKGIMRLKEFDWSNTAKTLISEFNKLK